MLKPPGQASTLLRHLSSSRNLVVQDPPMQQPSTVNPVPVAQMLPIPSSQVNAPFVPAPQPPHQHQGVAPPPPTAGGLAPPGSPGRKRKFEGDMIGGDGGAMQGSLSKPQPHNGPSPRVPPPSSPASPQITTQPAAAMSGPMSVPPPRGPISVPRLVPYKESAHSIHNGSTTNGALNGPQPQQQQHRGKGALALRLRIPRSSSSAPDDHSTAGSKANAVDTSKPQVAPIDTTTPTSTGTATAMPPHFHPPDGDYIEWISPRSSSSNTNTGPFLEPPCEGTPLPPAMQLPPHGASLVPRPLKTHQRQQMQGATAMPRGHGHVSVPPPSSLSSNSYAHTASPSAVSSLNAMSSRPRGDQPPPHVEPPGRPVLMKTPSGGAGHHTAPPSGSGAGVGAGNGTGGGDGIGASIPTQQEPPSSTSSSSGAAAGGGVEPPQAALSRETSSMQEINATGNALMGLMGATAAAVDASALSPPAKKAREAENEEWVPLKVRREIMDSTISKIKQDLEALKAGGLDSAVLLVWAERVVQEKERVVSNAQSFKRFMEHTTEEITKYEVAEAEATYKANLQSLKENMMDERLLQIRRLEEIIRTGVAEEAVMTRVNTRNTRSKLGNVKDLDLLGSQIGTTAGGMKRKRGQSPVSAYLQKTLDSVEMEMDLCQIHSDDKFALHDPDDEDPESRPVVRVRAGRTSVTVGDLHLHKSDNIMVTVVRTDEQYHATVQSFNTQEIFLKTSGGPSHQTGRRRVALQDLAEGQVLIDLATSPPPRGVRYSDHEDGIDPPTRPTRR